MSMACLSINFYQRHLIAFIDLKLIILLKSSKFSRIWLGGVDVTEEAKKNERTNFLKEVKRLCREFGFTAGMLKGVLAEGGKSK